MALPFLVGVFSSIKKNAKGSVKEAVKRHNGNLEKLRIKEEDCTAPMKALEQEELNCIRGLSAIVKRVNSLKDRPKFDELSVNMIQLIPFDKNAMAAASEDPAWFVGQYYSAGSWLVAEAHTLSLSEDADKAWETMEENEKKLNSCFAYYDKLQILAENYTHSLEILRGLYEKHISVLDQYSDLNHKTLWSEYGDTQKLAFMNTIQLAKLIYEMCTVSITKQTEDLDEKLNYNECRAMLDKAARFCGDKGFEYDSTSYDVVLRGSAKDYFNYCYRLEDKLPMLLPINREQVPPILEKLRMNQNISINQEVTQLHARAMADKLRDVDIKTQRVISPDGSSTYYIELI